MVSKAWRVFAVPHSRLRLERKRPTGELQAKDWSQPPAPCIADAPAVADCKGLLLDPLLELVSGRASPIVRPPPSPLQVRSHDRRPRRLQGALLLAPRKDRPLTRETMQLRLGGPSRDIEDKRIAELRARLTETLSALDRERTCRELTRMEGERIKTSLGAAHVSGRAAREIDPPPISRGDRSPRA